MKNGLLMLLSMVLVVGVVVTVFFPGLLPGWKMGVADAIVANASAYLVSQTRGTLKAVLIVTCIICTASALLILIPILF